MLYASVFNYRLDFKSGASTNSATLPRDLDVLIITNALNITKIRYKNTDLTTAVDALDIVDIMLFTFIGSMTIS